MRDSKLYKPMLAFLAVLLLCGSAVTQWSLNKDRAEYGLTRNEPLKNAPPVLVFTTVALGGFRGLIANVLWIRANDLQNDGKYFEMVQLADWITKLQPHFTTVWVFQAWNMAFNISIKFPNKEDRWNWIKRGIELLRDEAIKYNPHETLLYRELAWFYQDKIGQNMDDQHMYFKLSWAYEMTQLLGDPPYDFHNLLDPKTEVDRQRLQELREKYKMDPKVMMEVEKRYGPLDWRTPETMAIYWATEGLKYAKQDDLMPLRRIVYQSMQIAFQRGHLMINKADHTAEFGPNPEIADHVNASYEEMIAAEPNVQNIKQGHMNFLLYAVSTLYLFNREAEAVKWWTYLQKKYPEKIIEWRSMEDYVLWRVADILQNDGQEKFDTTIRAYLSRSYYLLAIGEDEQALGYQNFALKAWKVHMAKIDIENKPEIKEKLKLPPFEQLKREELNKLIDPVNGTMTPELAAQLRTRLGLPPPTNMVAKGVAEMPRTAFSTNKVDLTMSIAEKNRVAGEEFLRKNRDKEGVQILSTGVQYKILKQGSGPKPKPTDFVFVHYRGTLIDGKEFDNSRKRGEPFRFQVNRDVIPAWKEVLPLMSVGSKWQVFVPARMAYGETGAGGVIGPNETLIFEMELIGIDKPEPIPTDENSKK